jgi:transposase
VIGVLERLADCDMVEAVSMDMSRAFREGVQFCLPRARIVADHFQVIQHGGLAVKKVIGRWAKSAEGKKALDGHQHLFLRNKQDLEASEEQSRATLAQAFPEIAVAWQLKEDLRTWYATTSAATAATELDAWIATVKRDGPAALRKALSAFRDWRQEILAFFDFLPTRLRNGFVEGSTIAPKPSSARPMAIATGAICACVSCWRCRLKGFLPVSPYRMEGPNWRSAGIIWPGLPHCLGPVQRSKV